MTQIMIDLETMGKGADAAIVAIGAVRFDPEKGTLGETFYRVVNLESSVNAGGKIDAGTVMWWMGQGDIARNSLITEDSIPIETALKLFSDWCREKSFEGMWGCGSDFDNVIISSAYTRLGKTPPWPYYANKCYRTLSGLAPEIKRKDFRLASCAHHALDDAMTQARHMCAVWKAIGIRDSGYALKKSVG